LGAARPPPQYRNYLPDFAAHRVFAAFKAISRLRCGVNAAARAFPPFKPPLLANSVPGESGAPATSDDAPTDKSTIRLPSWFGSRGRLGRFGVMVPVWSLTTDKLVTFGNWPTFCIMGRFSFAGRPYQVLAAPSPGPFDRSLAPPARSAHGDRAATCHQHRGCGANDRHDSYHKKTSRHSAWPVPFHTPKRRMSTAEIEPLGRPLVRSFDRLVAGKIPVARAFGGQA
jgi:hypothetical protein